MAASCWWAPHHRLSLTSNGLLTRRWLITRERDVELRVAGQGEGTADALRELLVALCLCFGGSVLQAMQREVNIAHLRV